MIQWGWHLNICCAPMNSMNLSFLNLFKSHATFPGPNVAMWGLQMTNKNPRRQWSLWMTCVDGSPWIPSLPFHPNHKERGVLGNWEDGLPAGRECCLDVFWKLAALDSKINGWNAPNLWPRIGSLMFADFFDIEHRLDCWKNSVIYQVRWKAAQIDASFKRFVAWGDGFSFSQSSQMDRSQKG